MATNRYISQNVRSEQNLYEDLIIESIQFYGQDVYYLPREIINLDSVFLDDIPSRFSDSYKVEMYVENTDGFGGEGDLFTKFGIELRDQATFIVARKRWKNLIGDYLETQKFRPREGDLLFMPMSQSIFQIMRVETESPFYQLSDLPTFRLQCELFEYSDEDFDTDISGIDLVEQESAFKYKLIMEELTTSAAQLTTEIDYSGKVTDLNIISPGYGYVDPPIATIAEVDGGFSVFGNSSLDVQKGRGEDGVYSSTGSNGSIEFFQYTDTLPITGTQSIWFTSGGDNSLGLAKKLLVGISENGYIGYSSYDNVGYSTINITSASIDVGQWQHVAFFFEGTTLKIYINGVIADTITMSNASDIISADGFAVGANAARSIDGITWTTFAGHIDEYRAQVGDFATLLTPRLDIAAVAFTSAAAFTVPLAEFVADANTVYLNHWNGESAEVTLDVSVGAVTGGDITEQGYLYNVEPLVTVAPPVTGGAFYTNQVLTQTNHDYIMKGEVTSWNSETKELEIAHTGATDGKFHTWVTQGAPIISDTANWIAASVSEVQDIQIDSQNQTFDDFATDFLDFTESNPFGDPV